MKNIFSQRFYILTTITLFLNRMACSYYLFVTTEEASDTAVLHLTSKVSMVSAVSFSWTIYFGPFRCHFSSVSKEFHGTIPGDVEVPKFGH